MSDVSHQNQTSVAIDADEPATVVGYPKLARIMSLAPETAILRRFGELNMLNLLRLQAELHDLEHDLQEIRSEDTLSKDPVRENYVKDFRLMRDWTEEGDSLQNDLLVKIGKKLEEYNTALLHASELTKATVPSKREIKFLQSWLIRPTMGDNFLNDREHTIWETANVPDLITLLPRSQEQDYFTSLFHGGLLDLYDRMWGHKQNQPESLSHGEKITAYDERKLLRLSKALSGLISSLLPTLAILALYFVQRMLLRIGLVIIFTAVFSLTISLLTEASKVDVFAATAAFAAVEVVFIGSTNSTS